MSNPTLRTWSLLCCAAVLGAAGFWGGAVAQAAEISGAVAIESGDSSGRDFSRAVVYLDAHPALSSELPRNAAPPQIAQRGKAFSPNLLVVPQGAAVEFPNWDPFSHNVFSRSRVAPFDLDRYGQGQSKSYTFQQPGVVQIFCNIHPQMKAVVLVVPNRHFARADAQGRFVLSDVPPGRYTLVAWQERAAEVRQEIEVSDAGLSNIAVTLHADGGRETQPRGAARYGKGVERGLGVKRERLNLPVIEGTHPAPSFQRR